MREYVCVRESMYICVWSSVCVWCVRVVCVVSWWQQLSSLLPHSATTGPHPSFLIPGCYVVIPAVGIVGSAIDTAAAPALEA